MILKGSQSLLIIDPLYSRVLKRTLWKYGITQPVSHVFLSSSSYERVSGLSDFEESLDVFLASDALEQLKFTELWPAIEHHRFHPVAEKIEFVFERYTITFEPFPVAQSQGNSVIYLSEYQLLYTGALVLTGEHPFFQQDSGNLDEWLGVLEKLQQMELQAIVPGYGYWGTPDKIRQFYQYLERIQRLCRKETAPVIDENEDVPVRDNLPFLSNHLSLLNDLRKRGLCEEE
ncbi:MAG: hypothetical protein HQM11_01855 [SAR324 cluster bacterium]|nr:hypothetical protein [SAR324 cluster bacterium]